MVKWIDMKKLQDVVVVEFLEFVSCLDYAFFESLWLLFCILDSPLDTSPLSDVVEAQF